MLKIVIISPFYYPSRGGVESIVINTAEALAKRKNSVIVITSNYNNSWGKLSDESISVENNVTIYRIQPLAKIGYAAVLKRLTHILEKERPDIVHTHNLHPHLFQAIYSKNRLKYKIVAQLHYPLATGIDHITAKIVFPVIMKLLLYNKRKVDAFIVHSTMEEDWLLSNGITQRRIYKLRYPCFSYTSTEYMLTGLTTSRKDDLLNLNLTSYNSDILYLGRITNRKGIHILLKALSLIDDIDISALIVGPTDQQYMRHLLEILRVLDLKNVHFLPPVSEQIKFRLIDQCKIFVVPSILDYTPVTIIEAQAMGKPVISTYTGAVSELVRENETCLLVEPQNAQALAKAIKGLMLSKEKRAKMGNRANAWVEKNFALNDVIDKLERIYLSILTV
jgi:glycosyltransferase involved in cell wall biosynthesis